MSYTPFQDDAPWEKPQIKWASWLVMVLLLAGYAAGYVAPDMVRELVWVPFWLLQDPGSETLIYGETPMVMRLFTHMFVAVDVVHLAFALIVMLVAGRRIEDRLGPFRLIALVLVTGIAGAVAQAIFSASPATPVTGPWAMIYGVLAGYLVLRPRGRMVLPGGFKITLFILLVVMVGYDFLVTLVPAALITTPDMLAFAGMANWAVMGGLVAGGLMVPAMARGAPLLEAFRPDGDEAYAGLFPPEPTWREPVIKIMIALLAFMIMLTLGPDFVPEAIPAQ